MTLSKLHLFENVLGDALSRKSGNGSLMLPYNNLPSKSVSDLN